RPTPPVPNASRDFATWLQFVYGGPSLTPGSSKNAGSAPPCRSVRSRAELRVDDEFRAAVQAFEGSSVAHAEMFHDRPRSDVVMFSARHDGAHAERVDGVGEASSTDLDCVAVAPELGAERPSDLNPVGVDGLASGAAAHFSCPRLVG